MLELRECPNCKKNHVSKRKFCSKKCIEEYNHNLLHPRSQPKVKEKKLKVKKISIRKKIVRNCKMCEKSFVKRKGREFYCSKKCRSKARKKAYLIRKSEKIIEKIIEKKTCPTCGKKHTKKSNFCCRKCCDNNIYRVNNFKKRILNYYATPEGIAHAKQASKRMNEYNRQIRNKMLTQDDYSIEIHIMYDIEMFDDYMSDSWK